MKFNITLITLLTLSACGSDTTVVQGPKGEDGAPGETIELEPETELSFEGDYSLPLGGNVTVAVNYDNLNTVAGNIRRVNTNGSICNLAISAANIALKGQTIRFTGVSTMSAGNCQSDSGSALLTAAGVTYAYEVVLSFNEDSILVSTIQVFQTSAGVLSKVIDSSVLAN